MSAPREQLAMLLKRARIDAGFATHGKLASAMALSRSVVVKAESPTQAVPSDPVLATWSKVTGCDLTEVMELATQARSSAPLWFMPYLGAERVATRIQFYAPTVVPGLLQTRDYAMAHERSESVVEQRIERQKIVGRAQVTAVLDHRVLAFAIGTPAIMAAQCHHLVELTLTGKIRLHVVPDGANVSLAGAVAIASRNGVTTVNMGTFTRDITSTAPDLVDATLSAFDEVLGAALDTRQSLEFVQGRHEQWRQHELA